MGSLIGCPFPAKSNCSIYSSNTSAWTDLDETATSGWVGVVVQHSTVYILLSTNMHHLTNDSPVKEKVALWTTPIETRSGDNHSSTANNPRKTADDLSPTESIRSKSLSPKQSILQNSSYKPLFQKIKTFWASYISCEFSENNLEDHLANERTYQNWLALSDATSWMGIAVAQMSKVRNTMRPDHYNMFRYTACICHALAIISLLFGTYRFFCEQSAINGTGTRPGQWTLLATGLAILAASTLVVRSANLANNVQLCLGLFMLTIVASFDLVGDAK